MRKHGSGQACRSARQTPSCEECRAYARDRLHKEGQTPGTYRYQAIHSQGLAGEKQRTEERKYRRRKNDAQYAEILED